MDVSWSTFYRRKKRDCRIKDFVTQVCFWIMGEIRTHILKLLNPGSFLRLWSSWTSDMIRVRKAWLTQPLTPLCLVFLTIYSRKNFIPWKHTALGWKQFHFTRVGFIPHLKMWNAISYKTLDVQAGRWEWQFAVVSPTPLSAHNLIRIAKEEVFFT